MTKLFNLLLALSLLLLFNQCRDSNQDDPTPDDPSAGENIVKSKYTVEGLSDSFYKEYEAYTHFDIDTTSQGDTASYFFTEILAKDNIDVTLFFEEAIQQSAYTQGSSSSQFLGTMEFDRIFMFIDSGVFEAKTVSKNEITASVIFYGSTYGSSSGVKRYRMTADDITATLKGYIIPN